MHKFTVLFAALILSGCGFHLKGVSVYDHLPTQNWQVVGGDLQNHLETAVRHAKGHVSRDATAAQIRVLSSDSKKDIYTITRAAKLNEYLLSLRVVAQAYHADGSAWGEPMTIDVRRTMPYADSMILGKAEEEQIIWREMRHDAAQQIVRRLGFLNHAVSP